MKHKQNVIPSLLTLMMPLLPLMLLAVFLGVLGFICAIGIPVLGVMGIAGGMGAKMPMQMGGIFLMAGIFALLRAVLRYSEQMCNHFIAFKLLAHIRGKVFAALRKLCPAKLDGHDKGTLVSIITGDIELLEVFYAHTISPIAIAAVMTVVMVAFLGSLHPLLGFFGLLAYLSVGVVLPLSTSRASRGRGDAFRHGLGEMNSFVLDSLRGLGESIQYQSTDARRADMERKSDELTREEGALKATAGKGSALTITLISCFTALLLGLSLWLYNSGKCDFRTVILSTIAMTSSFGPVVALANLGTGIQQTMASARRVLEILDEEPEVEEVFGLRPTEYEGAACEDVNFAYEEECVLQDINLPVPQNKIVGITGRSGSGKSTLLKLLMRFWDVDSGRISISGRPIKEINTKDLRRMESYITQDTWLFHDTIENNVRIARLDATRDDVIAACKKASVHAFIDGLPNGYATTLSELGDNLSGGERQRIGLARAFLHEAPLMLLDEPTSNLDSLNEAIILKSLQEARQSRSVVLVSHRASTMKIAHQIYSVERGRLS